MQELQGAIPMQLIKEMMEAGYIIGAQLQHMQPASLDVTITDECYRLRGSYLPRNGETIEDIIKQGALFKHSLDRPLEHDGIYLIKLAESLRLPPGIRAAASNKSSSGRINLRGRLVCDGIPRFDDVPAGYKGSLWIEVVPKSFPIQLHAGDRVNQLRFFHGDTQLSALEHRLAFDRYGLLREEETGERIRATADNVGRGITMTVDLSSKDIIGWKAKPSGTTVLDTAFFEHDPMEFFEPVFRPKNDELILKTEEFFILSTKERIIVPPEYACEMAAYDATKGEFRSHFAGFFDPGWGWRQNDQDCGTIGVLEVEAYSHDFVLRDGQPICLMVYERMLTQPEKLYGEDLKSNYTRQTGPRLAKWFKM